MSYPQQPPPYQPQAPQQYQPQAPMGMLQLTIQGNAFTGSMIPPTVLLNGYPVRAKYGRNDIPVFAGPLHVDVHCQWMRKFGQAAIDFTVQPNQAVPVFYAAPYHQFTTGSIGHSKVKRKGMGFFLGLMGAVVVVSVLAVLVAALG